MVGTRQLNQGLQASSVNFTTAVDQPLDVGNLFLVERKLKVTLGIRLQQRRKCRSYFPVSMTLSISYTIVSCLYFEGRRKSK